jgi:hypothetical protein
MGSTDQVAPFHASLRSPTLEDPTATHDRAEPHETRIKVLLVEPSGGGTDCSAHLLPFHRSAKLALFPSMFA